MLASLDVTKPAASSYCFSQQPLQSLNMGISWVASVAMYSLLGVACAAGNLGLVEFWLNRFRGETNYPGDLLPMAFFQFLTGFSRWSE